MHQLLLPRDVVPFPDGRNASETIFNGVFLNRTALEDFDYLLYSNNTISNGSNCYLAFNRFQPAIMWNGTWANATSCYVPYYGIQNRGRLSIFFASAFIAVILFALVNLRKHGKRYLREDKRFRIIGRRWPWYWMVIVCACGVISCIAGIDVDRNYLQRLPIVLQSFFFTLMLPSTLAMVWETIRHWGSWQERQVYDRDPYLLAQNDRREKTEFYLPLFFYLFDALYFFMSIPRSWTAIQFQNSVEQENRVARPAATDTRWKAGAMAAAIAWAIIVFSLQHSLKHYRRYNAASWGWASKSSFSCPPKFLIILALSGARVAYSIGAAWKWDISILKHDVSPVWPFALGYGSVLLLLIVLNLYGYVEQNEDRLLSSQQATRERDTDAELGVRVSGKPSWWRKTRNPIHISPEERMRALTAEGFERTSHTAANFELTSARGWRENQPPASKPPFSDARDAAATDESASIRTAVSDQTLTEDSTRRPAANHQQVRSMLYI